MEGGEVAVEAVHALPYSAMAKGEDAVDEPREEVAVVRDDDDGPREGCDGSLEDLFGSDVQVVGRLIEDEQVGRL